MKQLSAIDRATWVRVWYVLWHVISFTKLATTLFCHFLMVVGGLFLIGLYNGPLQAMSWGDVMTPPVVQVVVAIWVALEIIPAALYSWRRAQYIATTVFVAGAILVTF